LIPESRAEINLRRVQRKQEKLMLFSLFSAKSQSFRPVTFAATVLLL